MNTRTFGHLAFKGFTLVELIVAMSILSIMSAMTFLIYFNISETARRLDVSRELSETAREITERLAEDIRQEGVVLSGADFDTAYPQWNILTQSNYKTHYSNGGSQALAIGFSGSTTSQEDSDNEAQISEKGKIKKWYVYGQRGDRDDMLLPCKEADGKNPQIHCGLYLHEGEGYFNLVKSFEPNDAKKRMKITDLHFYISGDESTTPKVTLVMTLSLIPGAGISAALAQATELHIQTTFSQRLYSTQ